MRKFLIVSDDETGWKALYIDGKLKECDESINIGNMVWYAGGEPVTLQYENVRVFPERKNFPDDASELEIEELKSKYELGDGAKYEPNPECERCFGTGERKLKNGQEMFCHCLFIEPDYSNEIGGLLSEFADKMRKDLGHG